MNLSKSWLIAAVIVALLYLAFPRYEMQVVSYAYPGTQGSGTFSQPGFPTGESGFGTAIVFRLDRWTGKVSWASSRINAYWVTVSDTDPKANKERK